jgi:hypothetical protein
MKEFGFSIVLDRLEKKRVKNKFPCAAGNVVVSVGRNREDTKKRNIILQKSDQNGWNRGFFVLMTESRQEKKKVKMI